MATINLDDLMEKAKELADAAGKKTGELYELSKYKYECIRLSNELKKLYERLGSTVYKQVKTGGGDNAEIDAITAEIDDRRLRMTEIRDIMAEMTNKKVCKNCGTANPKDSVFCAQCGAKLKKSEDACGCCCGQDENSCACEAEDACDCGCEADSCNCMETEKTQE